jgi:hypothetical protein
MDIRQNDVAKKRLKKAIEKFNSQGVFHCKESNWDESDYVEINATVKINSVEYSPRNDSYTFHVFCSHVEGKDNPDQYEWGVKDAIQKTTISHFRTLLKVFGLLDEIHLYSFSVNFDEHDNETLRLDENVDMFEKIKKFLIGRNIKIGKDYIYKIEDMRPGKNGRYVIIDYSVVKSGDIENSHYSHDDLMQMEMSRWFDEYFDYPIQVAVRIVFPQAKSLSLSAIAEQDCELGGNGAEDIGLLPLGGPRKKRKKKQETAEQTDSGSSGSFEAGINMPIVKRELPEEQFKIKTDDMIIPMKYEHWTRLLQDIKQYLPKEYPKVHHMIIKLKAGGISIEQLIDNIVSLIQSKGMDVSPHWRIVPNAALNEDELWDGFSDGDSLEKHNSYVDPVSDHMGRIDNETINRLMADIEEFYPECMPFIETWIQTHDSDEDFLSTLVDYCKEMGIIIAPNWRITKYPNLNEKEEDIDEATDYASGGSGSYETPGCWATGKGKQSIRNSRAVNSKQFKKFLYGGPKAKYVSVPDSVNTLSESTDIYNKSKTMNKSQIKKLVEDTIKQEVVNALNEDKPKQKAVVVKENTFLKLVDALITEEKHPAQTQYEKMHKESGKINKSSNTDTDKTMKDYASFEGNDKPEFPKAIGKGEKKMRINNDKEKEFIEDFKGKGQEDLNYDLEPNEEFKKRADMSLNGDSLMGNDSGKDTANVIKTDTAEEMEKKAKRRAKKDRDMPMYKKDDQPTGKQSDKDLKGSALSESTDTVLDNEMAKIKKLYSYSDRTQ